MSKSSLAVGIFLILAGLLFAVLLINSGNWDIALIAGLPPVVLGSWIAVTDKLGVPEPKEPKKSNAKTAGAMAGESTVKSPQEAEVKVKSKK